MDPRASAEVGVASVTERAVSRVLAAAHVGRLRFFCRKDSGHEPGPLVRAITERLIARTATCAKRVLFTCIQRLTSKNIRGIW